VTQKPKESHRRAYINNPEDLKPFTANRKHNNNTPASTSSSSEMTNLKRASATEVQKYENFFNTYVQKNPTSSKFVTTEQPDYPEFEDHVTHTALSIDTYAPVLKNNPSAEDYLYYPEEVDDEEESDLIYLETLLNNGVAKSESSLSDLFAEIVDNEKDSISNYESEIFDANVKMLFNEDVTPKPVSRTSQPVAEVTIPPPVTPITSNQTAVTDYSLKQFEVPTPPTDVSFIPPTNTQSIVQTVNVQPVKFEVPAPPPVTNLAMSETVTQAVQIPDTNSSPTPSLSPPLVAPVIPVDVAPPLASSILDLPPLANSISDSPIVASEVISTAATADGANSADEPKISQEGADDNKKKRSKNKKLKMGLIDAILIIIILAITALLVMHFGLGDMLPFDLPF